MTDIECETVEAAITADALVGAAGTLLAGVLAALVVVWGYRYQQHHVRRERRADIYAEALRAVHDYLEAPYLIVRRGPGARTELSKHISAIQSRLDYYQSLLMLQAPREVSVAYETLVATARREAGGQMTASWKTRPVSRDSGVPRGKRFLHPDSDRALTAAVDAMKGDL